MGCSTTLPEKFKLSTGKDILIGHSENQAEGVYAIVKKINDDSWDLVGFSNKKTFVDPEKNEERLFIAIDQKLISPAFDKAVFRPNTLYYECGDLYVYNGQIKGHRYSCKYHPCNSSITKNGGIIDGWFGWLKTIDKGEVVKIIEQTKILENYKEYYSYLKEEKKYNDYIAATTAIVDNVEDFTGLFGNSDVSVQPLVNILKQDSRIWEPEKLPDSKSYFENMQFKVSVYLNKVKTIKKSNNYNTEYRFNIPKKYSSLSIKYDKNASPVKVKTQIIVETCNLFDVWPKDFIAEDNSLSMKIKSLGAYSTRLELANKTKNYLTINSITLYYQDDVVNAKIDPIEIAPSSVIKEKVIPIGFKNITENRFFKNVNKKNLSLLKLNYGIAAKYTVQSINHHNTLYYTKNYKLSDVIR